MLGPYLTYNDEPHLERLLSAARAARIDVQPDSESHSAFWFRRGWGLVHGSRRQEGREVRIALRCRQL